MYFRIISGCKYNGKPHWVCECPLLIGIDVPQELASFNADLRSVQDEIHTYKAFCTFLTWHVYSSYSWKSVLSADRLSWQLSPNTPLRLNKHGCQTRIDFIVTKSVLKQNTLNLWLLHFKQWLPFVPLFLKTKGKTICLPRTISLMSFTVVSLVCSSLIHFFISCFPPYSSSEKSLPWKTAGMLTPALNRLYFFHLHNILFPFHSVRMHSNLMWRLLHSLPPQRFEARCGSVSNEQK